MQALDQYTRLLVFVRPYLGSLVFAVIAMIIVAASSAAVPVLVEPVMDKIFVARDRDMLLPIALGIVGLFSVKGIAGYVQGYIMGRVGHRVIADVRSELTASMLRQDLAFLDQTPSGEIVSRITYDTSLVQGAVTRALTGFFQHILTIVGLVGVVFYQNWRLASIAILVFPVAVWPLAKFGRMIRGYSKQSQEQMSTLNALLYESFTGIRVVKIFTMENALSQRIGTEITRLFETYRRAVRTENASHPVMEWIGSIGVAAVIMLGGRLVIDDVMTTGEFFSFTTAVFLLYDPVRRMNGTWQQIQHGVAAAERIFAWVDARPTIESPVQPNDIAEVRQGIRFEGVSFSYGTDLPDVLHSIDLDIRVGQVVALAGPSGGGKSTLVDLLPRLYDPTAGRISVDGIDIRDMSLPGLRQLIAMVDQQTVLFDDTVRANIRYGRPDATDEEVENAARAAYADQFIQALPNGYETVIGENGVSLSGGQRQRIAIARALLKDAPILILDEATSALDTESEREVQAALEKLMQGRTALVIAHRLSTIRAADRIDVVESGRIIESGRHEDLMRANGLYQRLHQLQSTQGE